MREGTTANSDYNRGFSDLQELLTSVTRKGQITLPAQIRRSLGVQEGDKIAVSLVQVEEGEPPQAVIKPARSVAEMTFGAVAPLKEPLTWHQMREIAREDHAQEVARKGM